MQTVKINNKWNIILPDHRAARPEWPTWESARLASLKKNISSKDTMFYVGTEEGDMAGLCAMWGAKMVLFEPNEKVWPNIEAIWKANNLPAPLLSYPGFASDETVGKGEIVYGGFPLCAGGKLISDHGFKELRDPGEIPQVKIDDVEIPFTCMSIDVEGSEGKVLRGAEKTLIKHHPKIWLSLHPEFLHEQYGEWGAELRKWIIDLGYKETLLDYPLHEVHLFYEH